MTEYCFFYLNDENLNSLALDIEKTTFSDIIRWNTEFTNIQDNPFAIDVTLKGDRNNNQLYDDVGKDFLYNAKGSNDPGDDPLYGSKGQDWLDSRYGNHYLYGGQGQDWLDGGYGNHHLYVSQGKDTFVLAAYERTNIIQDFEIDKDRVILADGLTDEQMTEFRSIDGSGNNLSNPTWGKADIQLLRLVSSAYEDGISVPRGGDPSSLPSPRAISNAVASQPSPIFNSLNASDLLWQWGQFIDHDLDLTEAAKPLERFNIPVPLGDRYFDPFNTGEQEISLNRSISDPATGTLHNPRQQLNQITAYLDASMVYGSDRERAEALRTFEGGKLKNSAGNLLPYNTDGLPNAGGEGDELFLAGDVRANEQLGLTALHTLFMREHNYWADKIAADDPNLSDEEIYQKARKILNAEIQAITYNEFLPILLGPGWIDEYTGYDETVNAGISNEFATAAYRVGHTMLPSEILRIDNDGNHLDPITLRNAFFNPDFFKENDIGSLLKGLASQKAQEVDTHIIDDVRNFLFGPPGAGGFDLASLNIQRGRDHGLPTLNDTREALGLSRYNSFYELTNSDEDLAAKFASVYESVDDVDLWIGGLAERHVNDSLVGETFHAILTDQFARLRDGDRFFYLNDKNLNSLVPDLEKTTFSDIIRRNTGIRNIQDNAFAIDVTLKGDRGNNQLYGGVGNDNLYGAKGFDDLYGHSGDDHLYGGKGRDWLDGGYGNDYLYGGKGRDWLDGGYGNDYLYGGKGRDWLDGGHGDDLLYGGQGKDTFVLAEYEGTDIIQDFDIYKDRVALADGLTHKQLEFDQIGAHALITVNKEHLAVFEEVDYNQLRINHFEVI